MEAKIIGHTISDGWEVKYRDGDEEAYKFFEPYLFEQASKFAEKHDTVSIIFHAKRNPEPGGGGSYSDMGRFYEKPITKEELSRVSHEWLKALTEEILQLDREQMP